VYRAAAVLTAVALIVYVALTAVIWRSAAHGDPLWSPLWSLWAQAGITVIAAVVLTIVWVVAAVVNAGRAARELHSSPRFAKPS
jgi:cytochrome b561